MTHSAIPTFPRRIPCGLPAGSTGKKSLLAAWIFFLILWLPLAVGLSPSTAQAAGFSDLKGNWAAPEIAKAVDAGYIKGYPDGSFKPTTNVTRAEFLTMVDNAFQLAAAQNPGAFRDVRPSAWYGSSVQAAVYSGLVSGYPDHTFRPQQAVTRQEAACILAPLLKLRDGAVRFTDTRQIAAWAKSSVSQLAAGGIITGYPDGTFRPAKIINRAEAVAIIDQAVAFRTVTQTPAPGQDDQSTPVTQTSVPSRSDQNTQLTQTPAPGQDDQSTPVTQTSAPGRNATGELAVNVSNDRYGEKVDITVVQGAVYNVAEQQDPQRLVVSVPDVTVVRTPLEINVGEGGLDKVTTSFSGTGPGTAEVEISFSTPVPLTYYTTPGQPGELSITVPPQIYKIETAPVSDFLAVNLWATGPLSYQTLMQGNPQQLVLAFPGTGLSPGLQKWQQQVSTAGIDGLQFSEPQLFTAQLAVQATQAITCSSDSSDQGQQMVLRLQKNTNPAGPSEQSGPSEPVGTGESGDLADKTIVLDPGHGGNDPGAIGPHGVEEKWTTLPIALKAADILRQQGANVIMTRTGDTNPDLLARPVLANDNRADVFVSIHANWIRNSSIGGTGTYTYAPLGTPLEQQRTARLHLASVLQEDLVKTLGLHDSGVFQDNFAVLRCTTMPAALVEVAFISNSWEERLLNDANFQQQAAAAIASGITRFLTSG